MYLKLTWRRVLAFVWWELVFRLRWFGLRNPFLGLAMLVCAPLSLGIVLTLSLDVHGDELRAKMRETESRTWDGPWFGSYTQQRLAGACAPGWWHVVERQEDSGS